MGIHDTSIGGRSPRFPSTIWTHVQNLKKTGDTQDAATEIFSRYWKPVYACIRIGWNRSNEDAKDMTQEFFVFLLEGDALKLADPERGRFRSYLKTVLKNFLTSEHRKATRVKRGGRAKVFSIDVPDEQLEVPKAPNADPEEVFDREWARTLVAEALEEVAEGLTSSGRELYWKVTEDHDLSDEQASYGDLAKKHDLTENQVKNYLQDTRRRIRETVILKIREYALDEDEVWKELDFLMGLWNEP